MSATLSLAPPAGASLHVMARSFGLALRAANRSPRTVETYLESVDQLARFLALKPRGVEVSAVGRDHVRRFIRHLVDTRSPATASVRFRALQQFFKFCVAEGEIEVNPMDGMERPHVPERPVPVLSDDQVRALLAECAGTRFIDRRDTAIIRLLDDTGMRRAELLALDVEDLDLEDQLTYVLGKGRTVRVCPFGPTTAIALDRYLRVRARHRYASTSWLWLQGRGRFQGSGLATMLKRRGARAGIGPIHPHQFRHTLAHNWLDRDGSEGDLMRLMGWRSREMLDRYGASAAARRARNAHRRMALGDRL